MLKIFTPNIIPPSTCVRNTVAEFSKKNNVSVVVRVRIRSTPNPLLEVTWTDIGFVQGIIVMELVVDDTHLIIVQAGFLVQLPRMLDRAAIIASKAMQVSSDCCCVITTRVKRKAKHRILH